MVARHCHVDAYFAKIVHPFYSTYNLPALSPFLFNLEKYNHTGSIPLPRFFLPWFSGPPNLITHVFHNLFLSFISLRPYSLFYACVVIITSNLAFLLPVSPLSISSAHQDQINLPEVPFYYITLMIQNTSVGCDISRIIPKFICLASKAILQVSLYSSFLFPF